MSGFEIPTYLLAKCKPKLENASWNFKHLLKNASANYWRTVTECTKFHMWIPKKVILFVLDKHQSCITENTLQRLLTILHALLKPPSCRSLSEFREASAFVCTHSWYWGFAFFVRKNSRRIQSLIIKQKIFVNLSWKVNHYAQIATGSESDVVDSINQLPDMQIFGCDTSVFHKIVHHCKFYRNLTWF